MFQKKFCAEKYRACCIFQVIFKRVLSHTKFCSDAHDRIEQNLKTEQEIA